MPESECALGRVDPLALAWAAGFFDGEGSSFTYECRPGYLRFVVAVPQSGGTEAPAVLTRFQGALLRLGKIEPQNDKRMWFWRSRSAEEGQAAIALLWAQLGPVKRMQAASAIRRFRAQYGRDRLKPRGPRRRRGSHVVHTACTPEVHPQELLDLAWAAGFLDAEGNFGLPRTVRRKNGPPWRRLRASASQHGAPGEPAAVLFRSQRILGGRIERHGEIDDFRWVVEGSPAVRTVYAKVRPWLGTVKREQGRRAIDEFLAQPRRKGDASRCLRGHVYSGRYLSSSGSKQRCRSCARILQRMKRAAMGIMPRRFTNVERRYTF